MLDCLIQSKSDFFVGGNMQFADIHIHAIYGVDDGARTKDGMLRMIDDAYSHGTRMMCLTPHFHPGAFGEHHEKTLAAFECLKEYASEKYSDLELYLGNEMRYSSGCQDWLYDGVCLTMGGTRYVLTEFSFGESEEKIIRGIESMFSFGYVPVLAHAERYLNISVRQVNMLRDKGMLVQLDTMSLLRRFGFKEWRRSVKMLSLGCVDFVSSDAHDTFRRPPDMSECYEYVKKKFGESCANAVFYENARQIFSENNGSEG